MTDHKKNVRGGHRASATKMINKAEELLAQDPVNYAQLAKIRLSLQQKVSVLKQLDTEIVDLVEEAEVVGEIERIDAYMEQDLKSSLIEQVYPLLPGTVEPAAKVKLPKLTIQPFKGELTSWTTFVQGSHSHESFSIRHREV